MPLPAISAGRPVWRPMHPADIPGVARVSDQVHGDFTEQAAVYAERQSLYPAGCRVLAAGEDVRGYLIAHPWRADLPAPPLDTLVGALPGDPDILYLHDLALLPAARGSGAGSAAVAIALAVARAAQMPAIALVAVNGADRFWAARGFYEHGPAAPYGPGSVAMRRECPSFA